AVFVIDAEKPESWKHAYETLAEAAGNPFVRGKQNVTFRLHRTGKLPDGASLCLIGGLPQLGDWNVGSPKLPQLGDGGSDVWTASMDLPVGAVFEYKFLLRAADGTPTWQQGGNAVLEIRSGMNSIIENTWEADEAVCHSLFDRR
ncbi:MAG TPA: carbohydrate-binding module family 20 domain-containing protein, partial [Candidatus Ozemobacteraceae bacterium]|nr:carbohydrate-binding module family 20 domain-containing protein [Candidatus Ozemobacteraceae bacterium]